MKKKLTITAILAVLSTPVLAEDVYVNGYERNNGVYVEPYHRTAPDNNVYDNYSTQGNINPYTGQAGTVNPSYYQLQQQQQQSTYSNRYRRY